MKDLFTLSFVSILIALILLVTVIIFNSPFLTNTYGQIPISNNTQSWIDKLNNVKVQLTYSPARPMIDTPTKLNFNIQSLHNSNPIKNLSARVIVTTNSSGQERTFKFTNITASNGNFYVNYLFPDYGVYEIISKINPINNDFSTLNAFQVVVPVQGTSTASPLNSFSSNIGLIIIAVIVIAGAAAGVIFIANKRRSKIAT